MLQTVSRLLPELLLILMTAVATHLVMSFAQTLMHYKLGHHPIGGKFFRNHINFHHAHYCKGRIGRDSSPAVGAVPTKSRVFHRRPYLGPKRVCIENFIRINLIAGRCPVRPRPGSLDRSCPR